MASETGETSAAVAEVAAGEGERRISLMSMEGQGFAVSEAAARVSPVIMDMLGDGDFIKFENIPKLALKTVVDYCNKRAAAAAANASASASAAASSSSVNPAVGVESERDDENGELLGDDLGTNDLYDVLISANFLGLEGLVDAVCEKVASMIKERTPRQIRETFHITDDLTAAEKAEIRSQYSWAFYDGDM